MLKSKHSSSEMGIRVCVSPALKQCFPKCRVFASDVHNVLGETGGIYFSIYDLF